MINPEYFIIMVRQFKLGMVNKLDTLSSKLVTLHKENIETILLRVWC